MTPYQVLKAKSKEIGWPEYYKTDLTKHDLAALRKDKPQEFAWVVRDMGTHLYYPMSEEKHQRRKDMQYIVTMIRRLAMNDVGRVRFFWFSDGKLEETTSEWLIQKFTLDEVERRDVELLQETCLEY